MQQTLTTLLSLSALALAAPTTPDANNAAIKVPVRARSNLARANGELDAPKFFASLNRTLQKYNAGSLKSYPGVSDLSKRQTGTVSLDDQYADGEDSLYYGPGSVGSQSGFTFDFDTGSSDTFVPGPSCDANAGCVGSVKYDNSGYDRGNTTTVTYGSGQVTGENYLDTVTVGGLTAENQNVISLTQAAGFNNSDSNSLMGMAFESIANSKSPPFFKTLVDQGKVATPEFGFYLGRGVDGTGNNSELILGGRDSSKYTGAVTSITVSSATYWQLAVDGTTVNGASDLLGLSKGQAAIDTGTTIILAPTLAATSIFARIPGSIPLPLELLSGALEPILFAYPCNTAPDVAITFGGQDYAINPEDLSLGILTGDFAEIVGNNTLADILDSTLTYCVAAIAGADLDPSEGLYVVGDSFLKNWYSIYSYDGPSVSFAKSL